MRFCYYIRSDTLIFHEGWWLKMLMDFGGKALAAADCVAFVLRRASRAVRVGLRTLLRQQLGLSAHSVAAASAAYARKPHRPPWVWGLVAMETITGSDAKE